MSSYIDFLLDGPFSLLLVHHVVPFVRSFIFRQEFSLLVGYTFFPCSHPQLVAFLPLRFMSRLSFIFFPHDHPLPGCIFFLHGPYDIGYLFLGGPTFLFPYGPFSFFIFHHAVPFVQSFIFGKEFSLLVGQTLFPYSRPQFLASPLDSQLLAPINFIPQLPIYLVEKKKKKTSYLS